ncbi:glycosyltransferase [Synechococcus sp. BS56D]|uniref:glycosyltransferase n=1 Tax=Synechococcus sp. BS56D TaxID=2055944 RepID=UPI001386D88A|nr:glycosyltransferase [Synechococcus sp. BS56D]
MTRPLHLNHSTCYESMQPIPDTTKTSYLVGRFVGSNIGGAELSSESIILDIYPHTHIKRIRLGKNKHFHTCPIIFEKTPDEFCFYPEFGPLDKISPFCNVLLYYLLLTIAPHIAPTFAQSPIIIGVGFHSIPLLSKYPDNSIFVFRSESDTGLTPRPYSSYTSIAPFLKFALRALLDLPFRLLYRQLLRYSRFTFAANSLYTRDLLARLYRLDPQTIPVFYPSVSDEFITAIRELRQRNFSTKSGYKIYLFGDSSLKGLPLFRRLSKYYSLISSLHQFCCVSRQATSRNSLDGITYLEWGDPKNYYADAALICVLSDVNETYCRVAHEASVLSIPLLAHNVGGITEAAFPSSTTIFLEPNSNLDIYIRSINYLLADAYE